MPTPHPTVMLEDVTFISTQAFGRDRRLVGVARSGQVVMCRNGLLLAAVGLLTVMCVTGCSKKSAVRPKEKQDKEQERTALDSMEARVAMSEGDVSWLENFLRDKKNVSLTDEQGRSLLHLVAADSFPRIDMAEILLAKGADVNAEDSQSMTPLHLAASKGDTALVTLLLEKGANVNAQDDSGRTPLHWVALSCSTETAEVLVEKGAKVSAADEHGNTPLHEAAHQRRTKALEALLEKGADVNVRGELGRTPLHEAAHQRCTKALEALLEKGADVNARGELGRTPLHVAAREGNADVARLLIKRGADITAKDEQDSTPLALMDATAGQELAELLSGPGVEVSAKTGPGSTVLRDVALMGNVEQARQLLARGADPNGRSPDGYTPLHMAVKPPDNEKMVKLLLEAGADVNAEYGEHKESPLHIALSHDREQVAKLLIAAGAKDLAGPEWDGPITVATQIHPDRWVAEIKLSFTGLRLAEAEGQIWGANFARTSLREGRSAYTWARVETGFLEPENFGRLALPFDPTANCVTGRPLAGDEVYWGAGTLGFEIANRRDELVDVRVIVTRTKHRFTGTHRWAVRPNAGRTAPGAICSHHTWSTAILKTIVSRVLGKAGPRQRRRGHVEISASVEQPVIS